jgi:hypothetical protein
MAQLSISAKEDATPDAEMRPNQGVMPSASAVLWIRATNVQYNQPAAP